MPARKGGQLRLFGRVEIIHVMSVSSSCGSVVVYGTSFKDTGDGVRKSSKVRGEVGASSVKDGGRTSCVEVIRVLSMLRVSDRSVRSEESSSQLSGGSSVLSGRHVRNLVILESTLWL